MRLESHNLQNSNVRLPTSFIVFPYVESEYICISCSYVNVGEWRAHLTRERLIGLEAKTKPSVDNESVASLWIRFRRARGLFLSLREDYVGDDWWQAQTMHRWAVYHCFFRFYITISCCIFFLSVQCLNFGSLTHCRLANVDITSEFNTPSLPPSHLAVWRVETLYVPNFAPITPQILHLLISFIAEIGYRSLARSFGNWDVSDSEIGI